MLVTNATVCMCAEDGGLLVLDIGHTGAGYYGTLAASVAGVSAVTVDTQPHCALWGSLSAGQSEVFPSQYNSCVVGRPWCT